MTVALPRPGARSRIERLQRGAAQTVIERERARRAQGSLEVLPTGSIPWHLRDLQRLVLTLTLALIGMIGSWVGISGTVVWSRQMIWLAVGIASTVVGAMGVMTWLLAAFRAVRVRQARMVDGVSARLILDDEPAAGTVPAHRARLVTGRGMTLFHRPDCPLVAGKAVTPLTAARRTSLHACGVCAPIASRADLA